jgi:hypothetical protein
MVTDATQRAMALFEQLPPEQLGVAIDFLEKLVKRAAPTPNEVELVEKIVQPVSPRLHERLRILIRQQADENLTPDEQEELIQLTQQVELLNVDRITHLASLAKIRQTTIPKLIEELGLKPIEYD